jgi:hypothetical protein
MTQPDVVVAAEDSALVLELDEVQRVAGEYQEVNLMPPTAVVTELEVRQGAERGSVGKELLDGVQALLFVGELRVGDRDPTAVLHRIDTPSSQRVPTTY